eukprot:3325908-Alexandrium_andersonii.AAC.1
MCIRDSCKTAHAAGRRLRVRKRAANSCGCFAPRARAARVKLARTRDRDCSTKKQKWYEENKTGTKTSKL